MSDSTERLLVKAATSVEERVARGDLMARVIFHENDVPFESSFTFALYNRVPAGKSNEKHIHENVENLERQSLRTDIPIGNVRESERRTEGAEYAFQDADPQVQPLKDEALIEIAKIWLEARP